MNDSEVRLPVAGIRWSTRKLSLGIGFICSREAEKEPRAIKWVLSLERWACVEAEQADVRL